MYMSQGGWVRLRRGWAGCGGMEVLKFSSGMYMVRRVCVCEGW